MTATLLAAIWPAATASVGLWALLRARGGRAATPSRAPSVLLLRPCAGDEPSLEAALSSSRAAGPSSRVRFLVASAADPATQTCVRVATALEAEGLDADVILTGARGPNRKVEQLAEGVLRSGADADVVLVADSDVALDDALVSALVSEIAEGRVAACWAPPVEHSARHLGDRASRAVLGGSLHAFPLLAALDPRGMVGKAFAIDRAALEQIGGFSALARVLGEDMELARRLAAIGARVVVSPVPARSLASGRTLRDAVARYARWITVIRAQRPHLLLSYPLLFAATPLQLLLSGVLALVDPVAGLVTVTATLLARSLTLFAARRTTGAPVSLVDAILADLVLLVAFARALSGRRITWRGVSLEASRGGLSLADGAEDGS